MSEFFDKEADESEGSGDESINGATPAKKRRLSSSDSSEDSDEDDEIANEEELCKKEGAGWIVDEDEEDEPDDSPRRSKKKKKHKDDEDEDNDKDASSSSDEDLLDDEDFALIQENLGVKIKKPAKRRVVAEESDEEEKEDREEAVARQIFTDDEEGSDDGQEAVAAAMRQPDLNVDDDDEGEYEDDIDDFIVDEGGEPVKKKKRHPLIEGNESLQEAQMIFGVDTDELLQLTEGIAEEEEEERSEDEELSEEDEDEEDTASVRARRKRRRDKKKRIPATESDLYELFDPSDLDRAFLSKEDDLIRKTDIPERFQLRAIPLQIIDQASSTYKEDLEDLEEEKEWIFKQAFRKGTISAQEPRTNQGFREPFTHTSQQMNESAIPKIREALIFMRESLFEVPFIAFYRKEYVEKDLGINELWKVWQWDEKWTQLRLRKKSLSQLVLRMRTYLEHLRDKLSFGERENVPLMPDKCLQYCRYIESLEEVYDIQSYFLLHYGDEIPKMKNWEREERIRKRREARNKSSQDEDGLEKEDADEEVNEDIEEEEEESESKHVRARLSAQKSGYRLGIRAGLLNLIKRFGLSAEHFAENMRDQYQRHEVDQCPMLPLDAANDFVCPHFPTSAEALSAARIMLAKQLSSEPLVRRIVRRVFYDRARLSVRPTKKGRKEVDELHPCYSFKYVKNKPVSDIVGDMFLHIIIASNDKLLTFDFSMDDQSGRLIGTYFDEVKQFFYRDEFSALVQAWNEERYTVVRLMLENFLYPQFKKELRSRLLEEAYEGISKLCSRTMFNWLQVAPYPVEGGHQVDEIRSGGPGSARVLAIAYSDDKDSAGYAVIVDGGGEVMSYLKLPGIKFSVKSGRPDFRKEKEKDLDRISKFILRFQPHVIAIGCESRTALIIQEDLNNLVNELQSKHEMPPIQVELVDNEPALVFERSKKARSDFPEYPSVLRQAISVARRIQDPLIELSQLMNPDDDILCIRFHPLQDHVPKEILLQCLETEFINRVNEVGVDVNRCLQYPHTSNLIRFVSGLGPRKGHSLLRTLKQKNMMLASRVQLVTQCKMAPHVVINCAGFLKIHTASAREPEDTVVEILDGSRVHPESYDLARKMAVDALEYEDTDEMNPSAALEEILESPERLRDLDLDAFAEELKRQDHGDKHITLYDIRRELNHRYKDLRQAYRSCNAEERFNMVTKETPDTFHIGRLIECQVLNISTRKPRSDELDSAQPVRSERTGLWICPFCSQEDFQELSTVWGHFDSGECLGQAVGVRTLLDNGVVGFIHSKSLSDNPVVNLYERVKVGMLIQARIRKIDIEKFRVDLVSRSSDLRDDQNKWKPQKDIYYDYDLEEQDDKLEQERAQKQTKSQTYVNRVIFHPQFKNMSYAQLEKIIPSMELGEVVIRPSSKGADHLTVSWKVDENIVQHIDVHEMNKANPFSLGKMLKIGDEEFEDLDEIIARYVQPMASLVREVMSHKYYRDTGGGDETRMNELLSREKSIAPSRIPYFMSSTSKFPGKFLLSYLPHERHKHEYFTVTPDGFRFRGQIFDGVNRMIAWFKANFNDTSHCSAPGSSQAGYAGSVGFRTPQISTTPNISLTPGHHITPGGGTSHSHLHDPRHIPSNRHTPNQYSTPNQQRDYYQQSSSRRSKSGYSDSGSTPGSSRKAGSRHNIR